MNCVLANLHYILLEIQHQYNTLQETINIILVKYGHLKKNGDGFLDDDFTRYHIHMIKENLFFFI